MTYSDEDVKRAVEAARRMILDATALGTPADESACLAELDDLTPEQFYERVLQYAQQNPEGK